MDYQFIVDFHVVNVDLSTLHRYSTMFSSDDLKWLIDQVYNLVENCQEKKVGFYRCYVKIYQREETKLSQILDGYYNLHDKTFFFN